MVYYTLYLHAELENLTGFQPRGGVDSRDFSFLLKLKCGRCGILTDKESCVSLNEEINSGRKGGVANMVKKCRECDQVGSMTIIPGKGRPLSLHMSETGAYAPIMMFWFDGFEPTEYRISGIWEAFCIQNNEKILMDFTKVDTFLEYHVKLDCPLRADEISTKFKEVENDLTAGGLYVTRVGKQVTNEEIEKVFSNYGPLLSVNKQSGGVVFVNFLDPADAFEAAKLVPVDGFKDWGVQLSEGSRSSKAKIEKLELKCSSPSPKKKGSPKENRAKRSQEARVNGLVLELGDSLEKEEMILLELEEGYHEALRSRNPELAEKHLKDGGEQLRRALEYQAMAKNLVSKINKLVGNMSDGDGKYATEVALAELSRKVNYWEEVLDPKEGDGGLKKRYRRKRGA